MSKLPSEERSSSSMSLKEDLCDEEEHIDGDDESSLLLMGESSMSGRDHSATGVVIGVEMGVENSFDSEDSYRGRMGMVRMRGVSSPLFTTKMSAD